MKTCSKCKKDLARERFVKSARYSDGLYPSCKDCRKIALQKTLEDHPMCSRCKAQPHGNGRLWCDDCEIRERGLKPRKFNRDPHNKLCSFCKTQPRARGKKYCKECANAYLKGWRDSHGGSWACLTEEQKRKATARRYINTQLGRGKIVRGPCVKCGSPNTEFHHLDYLDRTRNVIDLCRPCHEQEERIKKSKLTEQPLLL
jgi:hypothetical protein